MTTLAQPSSDAKPSGSFAARLREWFWRGNALRAARAQLSAGGARRIAEQRAAIAAELGGQALDPPGPWRAGNASHLAASLFIESIGWSLRALSLTPGDADALAPPEAPASAAELERLFAAHESLLLELAPGHVALQRLRQCALKREFENPVRSSGEVEADARFLSGMASRLVLAGATPYGGIEQLVLQRRLRLTGLLVLLVALAAGASSYGEWRERRADIAAGKPWLASSSYEPVCWSPQHRCDTDKTYFFHTNEENGPWLEIDLLRPERFSRVKVINRQDCCGERALPLLVEVSNDHQHWREVARRTDGFEVWRASLGPVSARWVRFRVARRSLLHLNDVRILK